MEDKGKLISSAVQVGDTPAKAPAGNHSPALVSSRNHRNFVPVEDQVESLKVNAVMFSSPPSAQRIEHSPFEASLSPGVLSSPGREESSQSELETTANDSFSLGSLSPERPIQQHCQFCHEGSPTRGHTSESSQSEGTGSSSSRRSPLSPGMFCHTGKETEGGKTDGYTLDETDGGSSQYGHKAEHKAEHVKNRDGANSGLPSERQHFSDMGLCSFGNGNGHFTKNNDVLKKDQIREQHSPEIPQAKRSSIPTQYIYQEQPHDASQNRSFAQQGLNDSSCTKNTHLTQEGQKKTSYSPESTQLRSVYNNQDPRFFSNQGDRSSTQQALLSDPSHSKNTDSPKEVQKHVQYPSEIVEPKQQSMPSQYNNQEPMFFSNQGNRLPGQQGPLGDPAFHKNAGLPKEVEKQTPCPSLNPQVLEQLQPTQYNRQEPKYFPDQGNRSFGQQGLLGHPPFHKNTDLPKEVQTQIQQPPESPQLIGHSQPSQYNSQEPKYFSNHGNRSFGQQGLLDGTHKHTDLPREVQNESEYSLRNPQMTDQLQPSQYNSQESKYFPINQGNRSFGEQDGTAIHKNTDLPKEVQKEIQHSLGNTQMKDQLQPSQYSSNQGNRFSAQQGSLNDPPVHANTTLQKTTQHPSENPRLKEPFQLSQCTNRVANQANQAFAQQGLMNNPHSLLGHAQHPRAMLANMMALGWQQTGYPRQPISPPFTPIFQGWNQNPLLLQQLLASRPPFTSPFQAGNQPWSGIGLGARGTVPHPGRGCRVPLGRAQDPLRRGRTFAPRFHGPGSQNIRTEGDSKTFVPGMSSANSLEMSDKERHNAGNDSLQNNAKPPTTASKSTNVESATREQEPVKSCSPGSVENSKMMPSATEGPPQDSVSREPLWVQSVSPSNLRDISTKPSATPSPEKAELKRIQRENDRLRQCIDWKRSGGTIDGALSKDKRYYCTLLLFCTLFLVNFLSTIAFRCTCSSRLRAVSSFS